MPYYWVTPRFYASGGGGESNTAPWTADLNIPPSSVYGLASISMYQGESASGATIGFVSYVTQDPRTGIPSEHTIASWDGNVYGLGWLAPSLWDQNVIIITLGWNCYSDGFMAALGSLTVFINLE